jgi:hypothetical protein
VGIGALALAARKRTGRRMGRKLLKLAGRKPAKQLGLPLATILQNAVYADLALRRLSENHFCQILD